MGMVIHFFKKRQFLFFAFLFLLAKVGNAQKVAYDYIDAHKKKAEYFMKKDSIPMSIILGVSMIESGMGTSKNCRALNNYFGVKGKNKLTTYHSAYKQYPSAAASFKDFVRIVKSKKYYPKLKGNMDYSKWLITMNKYGYATAKGVWIHDITRVIKRYHLADFDKMPDSSDVEMAKPIWGTDSTMLELLD